MFSLFIYHFDDLAQHRFNYILKEIGISKNSTVSEYEKVLRRHSLHGENSSLGFIEDVYQWY